MVPATHPSHTHTTFFRSAPVLFALLASPFMVILTMRVGNFLLLEARPNQVPYYLWALLDEPVNVMLAVLVTWPLAIRARSWGDILFRLALASMLSVMIDLDHFVAAESLSLADAINLTQRPMTHSLLFAGLVGVVVWLITRERISGRIAFLALTTHILRDAAGGGVPFLWMPFDAVAIPEAAYLVAQASLCFIAGIGLFRRAVQTQAPARPDTVRLKTVSLRTVK